MDFLKSFLASRNKMVAGIGGNGVAVFLAWAAMQFPSVVTCVPAGAEQSCTALGVFTQSQLTIGLMFIVNALFIERSAANK